MRHRESRKRAMSEINVVPYVDVMLVLLVIFMITAPLLTQGVHVKLPQSAAKTIKSDTKAPLVITVDENGLYYLNVSENAEKPIEPEDLQVRVAAELTRDSGRAVLVRGDKSVPYNRVVQAMVLLQHAGAESIGLVTDPNFERA